MAKTYADIQKEIASLQKAAEMMKQKEVSGVVDRIKSAIATYGLTAADLGLRGSPAATAAKRAPRGSKKVARKSKSAPRYRDEAGNTWSGHGRRPGWYLSALAAGKKPEDMLV